MEEPREEVYERIPWETLEEKGRDRQWLALGIAGAVVTGAFAYSFVSNRPVEPPPAEAQVVATAPMTSIPEVPAPVAPPPGTPPPTIVTEADLYAVDPDRLLDEAVGHARWFVREYLATDGTPEAQSVLRMLLPGDVPLPTVPEGVTVFVEWVESVSVLEIDLATYRVAVVARYMVSTDGSAYERMAPEMFTVDIGMIEGTAQVLSAPRISPLELAPTPLSALGEVPEAMAGAVEGIRPGSQLVGGSALPDGSWSVVVMTPGPAGVIRPESIIVGP